MRAGREMSPYIYNSQDWPRFRWDLDRLSQHLSVVRHEQGRLLGRMEALGFKLRQEAVLKTLTEDVLKSSEIEGEQLDAEEVRSSIARRLGWSIPLHAATSGHRLPKRSKDTRLLPGNHPASKGAD